MTEVYLFKNGCSNGHDGDCSGRPSVVTDELARTARVLTIEICKDDQKNGNKIINRIGTGDF